MYFFAAKFVTKKRREKMVKNQDVKCDGRCCTISLSFTYLAFSHLSLSAQVLTPKMFISCWFPDKKSEWQYHNNLADEIFFAKEILYYYIFWLALLPDI